MEIQHPDFAQSWKAYEDVEKDDGTEKEYTSLDP